MILAKQLREMTAVRQGQTGRERSLSFAFHSRLPVLLVMAIDFSQAKQEALSAPK